jgi:hypothetical protein
LACFDAFEVLIEHRLRYQKQSVATFFAGGLALSHNLYTRPILKQTTHGLRAYTGQASDLQNPEVSFDCFHLRHAFPKVFCPGSASWCEQGLAPVGTGLLDTQPPPSIEAFGMMAICTSVDRRRVVDETNLRRTVGTHLE